MKIQNCILALTLAASLLAGCAPVADAAEGNILASTAAIETTNAQSDSTQAGSILFSDSGITVSDSDGLEIDGTSLTITQPGTYSLSGTCSNGSVKVQKGTTGVTLLLNGLELRSDGTAPIVCAKSTEVTIEALAGTENTLSDTESNNSDTGNADAENAVLKCKDGSQVTLCGTGTLNIQANGKNGIRAGASTQEEGEASLTIRDLTLNISALQNDAVNAESTLTIESGTLTIEAGDDALHCDNALTIGAEGSQGPTIAIASCYEGLEGATVDIYSGDISISASDDCINAANSQLSGNCFALNIHGGTITAHTTSGDGFDSNGTMTISGGTVAVWTDSVSDNQPLDADGTLTISGGTILAAGGSGGMGMNLNATQPCVIFSTQGGTGQPGQEKTGVSGLLSKGASFTILNSQGAALLDGTAKSTSSFLLFSSGDLNEGESCTLSASGTETTAEVQTGSVSTGRGGMGGGKPNDFRQNPGFGEKTDGQDFTPGARPEDGTRPNGGSGPENGTLGKSGKGGKENASA